mgnify:CR=1 FL=1
MKKLFYLAFLVLGVACSSPTKEQQAAWAAEGYYRHLAAGEFEQFLAGRTGGDSLPAAYREQLLAGCRQFLFQQQKVHQGISEVSVTNARTDTLAGYTSVFLLLCFGDSTQEEIVVPMVEHDGRWLMK